LKGNERHDDFDYPDEQYRYFILAERFGWTPAEADEQPAALVDWMLAIAGVVEEVKSEMIDER
jgi:hypothetical protein